MHDLDSRRLTGPNLLWERPGAVIDVDFGDTNPYLAISTWKSYAKRMLEAVSWGSEATCARILSGGASLAVSAPVDGLYAATQLCDWAWTATCEHPSGTYPQAAFDSAALTLSAQIASEAKPALSRLVEAARTRGLDALVDTDELSIGMGEHCQWWSTATLPEPSALNWSEFRDCPIALITGTNGKTTSARLCAAIAQAAGLRPGLSSTDGIVVNGELIEAGDFSGPGGARMVLRHPDTQIGILETARGGLLRRGLGVTRANGALITNIASDHLGQFGVHSLEELADVKWVVTRALGANDPLVLNADEPLLVRRGLNSAHHIIWFSHDVDNPVLSQHVEAGGTGCTVIDDQLVILTGAAVRQLIPVAAIPICHGGKARHNVTNSLGVVGLALALGFDDTAIINGLADCSEVDNPGRCNVFRINGATVLMDYAHNPHGFDALLDFAAQLESKRRLLMIGHAGDRSDQDIRDLARCTTDLVLDRVIIKTLASFQRGRESGAIEDILHDQFLAQGVAANTLSTADDERTGVEQALAWARPGDLLILLVHEEKQDIADLLARKAS